MQKILLFLFIALTLEATGVVYLSKGLKEIGEPAAMNAREIGRLVLQGVSNSSILLGVALETAFFVMLLVLLKKHDVSLIWPLTSLGFVLTTFAAKLIRHEEVSALRWGGVILIVIGAGLVGWSEKLKRPESSTSSPPPGSAGSSAEIRQ